jgi:type I restriction-modification system DNA methylase subunit
MTKEDIKEEIKTLIDKFSSQKDYYKSLNYNETQTRQDFINPFFKALGWDIDNRKQQLETYRDVRHEDRVKINGRSKAPDYSFNIEGKRKFFVEAKKPAISINDNPEPALQVRNYGWNAKLNISVVTDFEEFAIYDCTRKPKNVERANAKRLKYIYYTDYLKEFDFIYDTFSYESVLKNSIENYAKSKINFKTAEPVDKEFLKSLENWREYLATTIALRNSKLEEEEINFAVQQTIDRIVFLKVCEDRKIENENNLFKLIKSGNLYQNLFQYFQIADQKYNSGLFDFKKDTITKNLDIDNKVIRNIITELYGKNKENEKEYGYNFAIIPVEILGLAYEQFLGKVIRLTAAHHAKIEEKPEVRKAGGVYYTPEYIVEYIVKNTVGKLIEGKTPDEIAKIKILDPSCGSGSFLLGAYQYLLDYHLKYYNQLRIRNYELAIDNNKQNLIHNLPITPEGNLTSKEKKRILLNNIYGVDIDAQAVEVTKLSLLLKALEGETETSIKTSLQLFNERVLPIIDSNIQCGNSLIAPDFYNSKLELTPKEMRQINVFDWEKAFLEVFDRKILNVNDDLKEIIEKAKSHATKALQYVTEIESKLNLVSEPASEYKTKGGFDCIIGNPPYIKIQNLTENQPTGTLEYFKRNYKSAQSGNFDIYVLFIEKSYKLLNNNGILGYIHPHKFFQAEFGANIRNFLAQRKAIREVVHFGALQIFDSATTYTCLLFLDKKQKPTFEFIKVDRPLEWANNKNNSISFLTNQPEINEKWNFASDKKHGVLEKIRQQNHTLGDITRKIFVGLQTSADKIYVLKLLSENENYFSCYSNSLNKEIQIEKDLVKLFLMGKDVKRYEKPKAKNVVIFPYLIENSKAVLMSQDFLKTNFPLGWSYLIENKKQLVGREKGKMKGDNFYAYIYPKNLVEFDCTKISTPDIANRCQFSLDKDKHYHTTTIFSLAFNEKASNNNLFYLGILNSSIMKFHIDSVGTTLRGGYTRFHKQYIESFPIPNLSLENKTEKQQHDQLVKYVETMLELNKRLLDTKLQSDKELLQRRISGLDNEINKLVYQLYDLTPEEIEIIEGKNGE